MAIKVNFPLVIAFCLSALLLALLGVSYFVVEEKEDKAYEQIIQKLVESPVAPSPADDEFCRMQDELAILKDKDRYHRIVISGQKEVIADLNDQLLECQSKEDRIQQASDELKDVRAVLVNMAHSPKREDPYAPGS